MSKVVVGLFKSTSEAQNVKNELIGQGYAASNLQVLANEGTSSAISPRDGAEGGLGATISHFFRSLTGGDEEAERHYTAGVTQGGAILSITVQDGKEEQAADLLEHYGAQNVHDQNAATSATAGSNSRGMAEGASIPVVEEALQVGKRQVQRGGVRVYSHLVAEPVEETVRLREEHVHVDRQRVDRPATEADFSAFKEGTIELTETAEEAVVSKSAHVVEEVVIGKETSERTQAIRDNVRHTEVEVEQLEGNAPSPRGMAAADYDSHFRNHFTTNYGASGKDYDSYAPAYQYGHTLANDPRYASGSWSSVETNAKSDWAAKGSGKWEDMKGAVREGWDKVRGTANASRA